MRLSGLSPSLEEAPQASGWSSNGLICLHLQGHVGSHNDPTHEKTLGVVGRQIFPSHPPCWWRPQSHASLKVLLALGGTSRTRGLMACKHLSTSSLPSPYTVACPPAQHVPVLPSVLSAPTISQRMWPPFPLALPVLCWTLFKEPGLPVYPFGMPSHTLRWVRGTWV